MSKAKKNIEEKVKIIDQATELWFLNRLIQHSEMQLKNIRLELKRITKEKQLLINIKKKWKA